MNHFASPAFWKLRQKLPLNIQQLADKSFSVLKKDPHHRSLHLKRVRKYWSVRIGLHHRALAVEVEEGLLWFWIGVHADYDKMIAKE